MTGCPPQSALEGFGECRAPERSALLEHVRACGSCRALFLAADPTRVFSLLALRPLPPWGIWKPSFAAQGVKPSTPGWNRTSKGRDRTSYAEAARMLGTTEATIKVMVYRMRQRYRELLRFTILQTVESPLLVDEELRHLLAVLRR